MSRTYSADAHAEAPKPLEVTPGGLFMGSIGEFMHQPDPD
jgi:hypothetical protein